MPLHTHFSIVHAEKPMRTDILGIPVDCISMQGAVDFVEHSIDAGVKRQYILAVNPEKVMVLLKTHSLRTTFDGASLLIPDGIGVVWAMRWLRKLKVNRIPGTKLMPRLCELAVRKRYRVFLFGSREEVNRQAAVKLCERYPGLQIVGRSNGYLKQEQMFGLIGRINALNVDVLFVALGSPKQEQWIQQWLPELNVKVCHGVGGLLDRIVSKSKQTPEIFCRFGLEWFYRLMIDPRRIRRQRVLPIFALMIVKEKIYSRIGGRDS